MVIEDEQGVERADAFLRLNAALSQSDDYVVRVELARTLDLTNPGWRERDDFVARIAEIGTRPAATSLLARYEA